MDQSGPKSSGHVSLVRLTLLGNPVVCHVIEERGPQLGGDWKEIGRPKFIRSRALPGPSLSARIRAIRYSFLRRREGGGGRRSLEIASAGERGGGARAIRSFSRLQESSMDSDLWASRVAAAKRQYSLQQHQNSRLGLPRPRFLRIHDFLRFAGGFADEALSLSFGVCSFVGFFILLTCGWIVFFFSVDRLMFDDFDLEEEGRLDFPCPYCCEDHDIASLCSHLEEEHAFESKPTVSTGVLSPKNICPFMPVM